MCTNDRNNTNANVDKARWSTNDEDVDLFHELFWLSPDWFSVRLRREFLELEYQRVSPSIRSAGVLPVFCIEYWFWFSADCWDDVVRWVFLSYLLWFDADGIDAGKWWANRLHVERQIRRLTDWNRYLDRFYSNRFARASKLFVDRDWFRLFDEMFSQLRSCDAECINTN